MRHMGPRWISLVIAILAPAAWVASGWCSCAWCSRDPTPLVIDFAEGSLEVSQYATPHPAWAGLRCERISTDPPRWSGRFLRGADPVKLISYTRLPLWPVPPLTLGLTLFAWWPNFRDRRRPVRGCPACAYDRRGL